ncbi:MAG: exodeoxyribonuclease VII small subunit [Acidimicrobiia bacterium]
MSENEEVIGYADAMHELEAILDELEGDELDVDVLAERVRRASELIKLCRTRITRAQDDVARIVADLEDFDADADADADGADDTDEEDPAEPF